VAVMILRPEGLVPDAARKAELEESRIDDGPQHGPEFDVISGDA